MGLIAMGALALFGPFGAFGIAGFIVYGCMIVYPRFRKLVLSILLAGTAASLVLLGIWLLIQYCQHASNGSHLFFL